MRWILKNEHGFTLLETLLSLLISSFVLLLLTGGILQVVTIRDSITSNAQESSRSNVVTGDRQVEWHIFLNQLENYLQDTYDPTVGQLTIDVKEKINTNRGYRDVLYSRDRNKVNFSRKTENGNHRMLTGVNTLEFSKEGGWLTLDVLFTNGDRYSGQIFIDSWVEKEEIAEEENPMEDEPADEEETVEEALAEVEEPIEEEESTEENEPAEAQMPEEGDLIDEAIENEAAAEEDEVAEDEEKDEEE